MFRKVDEEMGIFRQVTINDGPPDLRHHLTKRPTQDDIARRTGTQIVTRGRYMAPGMPPSDSEQPLYLHITPGASATEARFLTCSFPCHHFLGVHSRILLDAWFRMLFEVTDSGLSAELLEGDLRVSHHETSLNPSGCVRFSWFSFRWECLKIARGSCGRRDAVR